MTAGREDRDWLGDARSRSRRAASRSRCSTTPAIRELLRSNPRIAMVGASSNPGRPSHGVLQSLRRAGYDVVAVNPRETEIEGLPCYPTRRGRGRRHGPVDIVDVFRRPDLCVEHAREAVAVGCPLPVAPARDRERRGGPDRARGRPRRRRWTGARSSSTGASPPALREPPGVASGALCPSRSTIGRGGRGRIRSGIGGRRARPAASCRSRVPVTRARRGAGDRSFVDGG